MFTHPCSSVPRQTLLAYSLFTSLVTIREWIEPTFFEAMKKRFMCGVLDTVEEEGKGVEDVVSGPNATDSILPMHWPSEFPGA